MPVSGPIRALRMRERGSGDQIPMRPIRLAAMVFAPCHFVRVGMKLMAADPMMNAGFGSAELAGILLCPIGRRAVLALVLTLVDPHHWVAAMKDIPAAGFIGMDGRPGGDIGADHRDRIAFPTNNPRPGVALAFASDDDDLALGIEGTAIDAIGLPIRLSRTLAEISAINFGLPSAPPSSSPSWTSAPIASRNLWSNTKALLGLIFMSRAMWSAATPLSPLQNRAITAR